MTVVDPWRAGCFELVVVFWSRRFLLFHTWPQVLVGQHPVLPDNWHYLCYETFPSTEDSLINFAGLLIHTQVRKKKSFLAPTSVAGLVCAWRSVSSGLWSCGEGACGSCSNRRKGSCQGVPRPTSDSFPHQKGLALAGIFTRPGEGVTS